ncbi:MAG: hypothetical protein OT477_19060 [Chloroflexi bacterium]|nr:hypothetical protein [Chloroflexota bacterium]
MKIIRFMRPILAWAGVVAKGGQGSGGAGERGSGGAEDSIHAAQ